MFDRDAVMALSESRSAITEPAQIVDVLSQSWHNALHNVPSRERAPHNPEPAAARDSVEVPLLTGVSERQLAERHP